VRACNDRDLQPSVPPDGLRRIHRLLDPVERGELLGGQLVRLLDEPPDEAVPLLDDERVVAAVVQAPGAARRVLDALVRELLVQRRVAQRREDRVAGRVVALPLREVPCGIARLLLLRRDEKEQRVGFVFFVFQHLFDRHG
jgi:hypothetical protein